MQFANKKPNKKQSILLGLLDLHSGPVGDILDTHKFIMWCEKFQLATVLTALGLLSCWTVCPQISVILMKVGVDTTSWKLLPLSMSNRHFCSSFPQL